jgi:hypothetical protein
MEKTLSELYEEKNYAEITKRFEKYLARYKEIFTARTTTKKVIGLAKSSTDIYRTLRYLTHTGSPNEVHQMRMSIIETFGEEEMHQIIYLAFYETLSRYDITKGVPLEKFIYNYYPYIITNEVNKLAGPRQILNDTKVIIPEEYYESEDELGANMLKSLELDYKWVEGECEEPFSCLTPLERKLLILIYIDKKTHEEIANDMRYHFSSIKRKKNDILEKLQRRMEELEDSEIY